MGRCREGGNTCIRQAVAIDELNAEIKELKSDAAIVRACVDEQAENKGLWFNAQTAPEAYLMRELRLLHRVIEGKNESI